MDKEAEFLAEAYASIHEKKEVKQTPEEAFETFLTKRAAGAAKIAHSTKEKGGLSLLTSIHFAAKAKPYAESEKWHNKEGKNEHFKAKAKEVYEKLKDLDSLSQKQFQALMGELEVWGEVYIRSTKPNSIKL
jgi:sarcosine oxidase delta subunit